MFLSKHDAFNKGLTTCLPNPSGKGKQLIVLHIGLENGFLPGGLHYHDEMNGANFKRGLSPLSLYSIQIPLSSWTMHRYRSVTITFGNKKNIGIKN